MREIFVKDEGDILNKLQVYVYYYTREAPGYGFAMVFNKKKTVMLMGVIRLRRISKIKVYNVCVCVFVHTNII